MSILYSPTQVRKSFGHFLLKALAEREAQLEAAILEQPEVWELLNEDMASQASPVQVADSTPTINHENMRMTDEQGSAHHL